MIKQTLYALAISSFAVLSVQAHENPTPKQSETSATDVQEEIQNPMAGCGCKKRDKEELIACCGEEEENELPTSEELPNTQACSKCGSKHGILATSQAPVEPETESEAVIKTPEEPKSLV